MNNIYLENIRKKVCVGCVDTDGQGNCMLHYDQMCAVEEYLPLIIQAVRRVFSNKIEDYVVELRATVCSECKNQAPNGSCLVRNNVDCGLDRYFPLIVEAIEETELSLGIKK